MVGTEPTQRRRPLDRHPDRLQQCRNRLQKHYEHLTFEDRKQAVLEAVKRMDFPDADRRQILRRLE